MKDYKSAVEAAMNTLKAPELHEGWVVDVCRALVELHGAIDSKRKYYREYRQRNSSRYRQTGKEWREKNRDKVRAYNTAFVRRMRAKKKIQNGGNDA